MRQLVLQLLKLSFLKFCSPPAHYYYQRRLCLDYFLIDLEQLYLPLLHLSLLQLSFLLLEQQKQTLYLLLFELTQFCPLKPQIKVVFAQVCF